MKTWSQRVVIVTGGGTGLGRAIADRLGREGAAVVVAGRRTEPLKEAALAVDAGGGRGLAVACDITRPADAENLIADTVRHFGSLDSLVNNAGAALRGTPLDQLGEDQWDAMLDVNLKSVWRLSRLAIAEMRRAGEGHLHNIASNLGQVGLAGMSGYMAAKAAVISLTRAMALDFGPEGFRANAICPGLVRTPLTEPESGFAQRRDFYQAHCALGRIGEPRDIAGAAAFLLGPEASWITGQALTIDGGYTIQ